MLPLDDARVMRSALVARYDGQDTSQISETDWLAAMDASQALRG